MKKTPPSIFLFPVRYLGFSLIEIVIALGVVSFAMMGIVGLIVVGMNTFRSSMDTSVQARIAQRILNEAQVGDYENLAGYEAYFDGEGKEVEAQDAGRRFIVAVTVGRVSNSLTETFSTNVARDLVVEIRNAGRAGEVRTFSSVMVKND